MRIFLFISSGILFICIAAALIIIGTGEKDNIFIMLAGMAIPFMFIGFWNIYNVVYEKKVNYCGEYFTYQRGLTSFGIGAFYNKKIIIPVFTVMFGTASLAIVNAFLASTKSTEDIAIAVLIFSFVFAAACTIYFLVKINKELKQHVSSESEVDDIGFKVAFFFASVATLGLFAMGWWIYKKLKKSHP